MLRIFSLLWTLLISLIVCGGSYFYIRGEARGFPFSFLKEMETGNFHISFWFLIADIIIWWLIFSVLWIILKNYVFEN